MEEGEKMKQNNSENYYLNRKAKLMKDFDKVLKIVRKVLGQNLDQLNIDQILKESRREYDSFLPQLPYIGGKKNSGTFNLIGSVWMLAIIRPLERGGLSVRKIGKIIYEIFEMHFESNPRILNWLIGKLMTSKFFMKKKKKQIEEAPFKQYTEGWVYEYIENNGENFGFGLDVIECGICKFYKKQKAEKYIPYLCLGDYPQFRAFGIEMKRTQTLGNGASKCDFRFKKGGTTQKGWPPDDLEEFNPNIEYTNREMK